VVLEGFIAPTLKEDGCLRYDLFADADDPTKFTFIEEWASREALNAHGQSGLSRRAGPRWSYSPPERVQVLRSPRKQQRSKLARFRRHTSQA
jgi:hypothetical protein